MKLSADARRFLLVPLIVIILGAVMAAGGWIWSVASCCDVGANFAAGALWLLGLCMLVGGALWALLLVLVGLRRGK